MALKSIWEDKQASKEERILQSVAWLPHTMTDQNQVIVGTSSGRIKLIDVDKNRVLWKDDLSKNETIFDLDINEKGILAISLLKTV
jgi:outer membrane protein assembly factor BamB